MNKYACLLLGALLAACSLTSESTIDMPQAAAVEISTDPAAGRDAGADAGTAADEIIDVITETAIETENIAMDSAFPSGAEVPDTSLDSEIKPIAVLRRPPFTRGVNFTQWLEAASAEEIQYGRFIEQDFANVKSLGVDLIRLPVNMRGMTLAGSDYILDPLLLKILDAAVDWAEKYGLYIIICNNSLNPALPMESDIGVILPKVWAQLAARYKDRSEYIVYEILSSPHDIPDWLWGEVQGTAINAIREIDKLHSIVVGGTGYNSIEKLPALPNYNDTNLIYTFHFYDPEVFTRQGANRGSTSMQSLSGVPFPSDPNRMPSTPDDLKGTWVESALGNYEQDSSSSSLMASLDAAVEFSRERDVPVFCGEFGAYMVKSSPEDRVQWYELITRGLEERGIARASWDYFGAYGLFRTPYGIDINTHLNVYIVRALMLTPPNQNELIEGPLKTGFTIYEDFFGREYSFGYWEEGADFSTYDTRAAEGEYAIRWGNAEQFDAFWIAFDQNGDFSALAAGGGCLEFRARTLDLVRFDVRFVNPEHSSSTPWRMRYSVDESMLPPDGVWHTIRIPFADMSEHGAWVNASKTWLTPEGKFSWADVRQLDFVAESTDLKNRYIWFDSIKITLPEQSF